MTYIGIEDDECRFKLINKICHYDQIYEYLLPFTSLKVKELVEVYSGKGAHVCDYNVQRFCVRFSLKEM